MPSPLENLTKTGDLQEEAPNAKEYAGLVSLGLKKLADAQNVSNSLEGRFDLAYNAAHALCLAALRRLGYRPKNRYIVFQVLPHTLGLGPRVWRVLAESHGVRNRSEYGGDWHADDRLLEDVIEACKAVAVALEKVTPLQ